MKIYIGNRIDGERQIDNSELADGFMCSGEFETWKLGAGGLETAFLIWLSRVKNATVDLQESETDLARLVNYVLSHGKHGEL